MSDLWSITNWKTVSGKWCLNVIEKKRLIAIILSLLCDWTCNALWLYDNLSLYGVPSDNAWIGSLVGTVIDFFGRNNHGELDVDISSENVSVVSLVFFLFNVFTKIFLKPLGCNEHYQSGIWNDHNRNVAWNSNDHGLVISWLAVIFLQPI